MDKKKTRIVLQTWVDTIEGREPGWVDDTSIEADMTDDQQTAVFEAIQAAVLTATGGGGT